MALPWGVHDLSRVYKLISLGVQIVRIPPSCFRAWSLQLHDSSDLTLGHTHSRIPRTLGGTLRPRHSIHRMLISIGEPRSSPSDQISSGGGCMCARRVVTRASLPLCICFDLALFVHDWPILRYQTSFSLRYDGVRRDLQGLPWRLDSGGRTPNNTGERYRHRDMALATHNYLQSGRAERQNREINGSCTTALKESRASHAKRRVHPQQTNCSMKSLSNERKTREFRRVPRPGPALR